MSIAVYRGDIEGIRPLLTAVMVASMNQQAVVNAGLSVGLIPPATGACIVLALGRFEQFIKDEGNRALDHFGKASPPVTRMQLSRTSQLKMISENLRAAMRRSEHGVQIPDVTRIAALDSVANRIASGDVWGDNAIDTKSNPNPAVVKEVLQLVGIEGPWARIETEFAPAWSAVQSANAGFKSIPSAEDELQNWVGHRNSVAHTNSLPPLGPHELDEMLHYFLVLGEIIDQLLRTAVTASITALGSTPATW